MEGLADVVKAVRFAVFDFDGVFTDNAVWVDGDGGESIRCCCADGSGRDRAGEEGRRGMHPGCRREAAVLREQAVARGVLLEQTAYLGNDRNDEAAQWDA